MFLKLYIRLESVKKGLSITSIPTYGHILRRYMITFDEKIKKGRPSCKSNYIKSYNKSTRF